MTVGSREKVNSGVKNFKSEGSKDVTGAANMFKNEKGHFF
jgi:hypothetical protein